MLKSARVFSSLFTAANVVKDTAVEQPDGSRLIRYEEYQSLCEALKEVEDYVEEYQGK